LTWKMYFL